MKYGNILEGTQYDNIVDTDAHMHNETMSTDPQIEKENEGYCNDLRGLIGTIYYLKFSVDKSIVVVNYFLRLLIIWLVKKMGYKTRSKETMNIMIFVFII